MKQPKKLTKPDNENGLALWVGGIVAAILILGCVCGCEELRLTSTATTMPATTTDLDTPEKIVAQQRKIVDAILASYIVEQENLAKDYVTWLHACISADVLIQQVARGGGTEAEIRDWNDRRKTLEIIGAELDAKAFVLRAELDKIRMSMVLFDGQYPGWWLMGKEKK